MKRSASALWAEVTVRDIAAAVYVAPGMGKSVHKDRLFHGLVLNESEAVREYYFSDGRVMRAEGGELFYLPKGSTYTVRTVEQGGCYAINFEADISDSPFSVGIAGGAELMRSFRAACVEWRAGRPAARASAMRALYDAIARLAESQRGEYMPEDRYLLIEPALRAIEEELCNSELSVEHLAKICGISEVYLRRIFMHKEGVSPKEYIIRRRMEHARGLLASDQLEVAEVARLCGYSEPCHFSREFKKRFGVSPGKSWRLVALDESKEK